MGLRRLLITSEMLQDLFRDACFHGSYFVKNGLPDDACIMDVFRLGGGRIEVVLASSQWESETSQNPPHLTPVLMKSEIA